MHVTVISTLALLLCMNTIGVKVEFTVIMRDGIHLSTDVYLPGNLKYDVILIRTPYDKEKPISGQRVEELVEYFVFKHGFALVVQDVRGRGLSEGTFTKYTREAEDGYDTIEWVVSQDWCTGKVGMMGTSYLAHVQMAAASLTPHGLSCLFVDEGGFSNAYQGGIRNGGAFEMKQLTWAFDQAKHSPEVLANHSIQEQLEKINLTDWFKPELMPWKKGKNPLSLVPSYEDSVFDEWRNGIFNSFWQQRGLYAEGYYNEMVNIPMIHISAWYDPYSRTAVTNYVGLKKLGGDVRLIMGPWIHSINRYHTYSGDVDFGESAAMTVQQYNDMRLDWFNYCLRKKSNSLSSNHNNNIGVVDQHHHHVKIFVMGNSTGSGKRTKEGRLYHGGTWRYETDWPLVDTRYTTYYFHSDRKISQTLDQVDVKSFEYIYDPLNPVPSIGGTITSGQPVMVGGAFDQRTRPDFFPFKPPYHPLSDRSDIIVFTTDVLPSAIEITGTIEVHLFVSSSCIDTDITVKLIDVYPPSDDFPSGFAMNLNDGILRLRYRNGGWSNPKPLNPDEIYEVVVELPPISNVFAPGHRIRVDVSSRYSSSYCHSPFS
eukprot:TRINITY_DN1710_c0_g1_i1.p1 TRINITY_DN1710_c0_g1~~TRINITY_DN1710_c0_g1_i1.p1  ORF type:complete len:596 (+),score=103.72 TRINITY_DN1710_c0_g1_i1:11-1798(+)